MRWLGLGLALAALAAACRESGTTTTTTTGNGGSGAGSSVDPQPLVIANWNLHNFLNDKNDSAAAQELVVTTAAWTAHRQAVGKVVQAIDADIVVFNEMENQNTADDLNELELASAYPHRSITPGNDPRGINIAVFSKLPFDEVVNHATETFTKVGTPGPIYTYARDCVEVHLTFNGRPLVILAVHYKSKENDDPDKRLAEAQHTRALADSITAASPETGVLILGDFNDTPGSFAYDWTVGNPPRVYLNAPDNLPIADRWTFDFNGSQELVDQQMGSPVLGPMVDPTSVQIVHGTDTDAASDHAPVVATYLVN